MNKAKKRAASRKYRRLHPDNNVKRKEKAMVKNHNKRIEGKAGYKRKFDLS